MLIPIKEYFCEDLFDRDIQEAIDIAKTEGCRVRVSYTVFGGGLYQMTIFEDDTVERVRDRLPQSYGI